MLDSRPAIPFDDSLQLNHPWHLQSRQGLEQHHFLVRFHGIYTLIPSDWFGRIAV